MPPLRILLSNAATGATMSAAGAVGTMGQRAPPLFNFRARRQDRHRWPPDEPPSRALPQITSADRATRTEQNAQPVHRQCVQSTLSAVHWTHRFFDGGMWGVARRLDIRPEIRIGATRPTEKALRIN